MIESQVFKENLLVSCCRQMLCTDVCTYSSQPKFNLSIELNTGSINGSMHLTFTTVLLHF